MSATRSGGSASRARELVRAARRRLRRAPGGAEPPSDLPLFDQPFYQDITEARLRHLAELGLPLEGKSLIDVGCGIGRLSGFFVDRGCEVLCVDGREENIAQLRQLYPDRRAVVVDVESDRLLEQGAFDVVFCYGLLYHLSDPLGFIDRAARICREYLIIETCITDAEDPLLFLINDPDDPTMALHAVASRPSSSYVATCLRLSGFDHLYSPRSLPDHQDFLYRRRGDLSYLRDGKPLRDIFIAARQPLENPRLRRLDPPLRTSKPRPGEHRGGGHSDVAGSQPA